MRSIFQPMNKSHSLEQMMKETSSLNMKENVQIGTSIGVRITNLIRRW